MSWFGRLRAVAMSRLALCAVAGFLWDRERITDEEVLRCLRESEQRRGAPLTESLKLPENKSTLKKKKTTAKRRVDTIRATPVLSPMPVSRSTALMREQRARRRKEEQRKQEQLKMLTAKSNAVPEQNKKARAKHNAKQNPQQTQVVNNDDKLSLSSWWDVMVGYTLGAVYSSYKGITEYFSGSDETVTPSSAPNDDCKPSHVLLCDNPSLLAQQCLGRSTQQTDNEDSTSLLQSLLTTWNILSVQDKLPHQWIDSFVNGMVSVVNDYTGIPVPVCVFEDALVGADYSNVTVGHWTPQQQLSSVASAPSSKTESCDDETDWQLSYQSNDTTLFVRPYQNTNLSQYRVISRFDDITAVDFLAVQADPMLRQQWDDYTGNMKVVDCDDVSHSEVLYWEVKFPFPLSKRDYVFVRRSVTLPHAIALLNRSTQHPAVPPSRGCVRVDNYDSVMVIAADTSVEKDGFYFEVTYVDDPKCNMPSSLSNWASSSGMMNFLSEVHKAALKRKEQKTTKNDSPDID